METAVIVLAAGMASRMGAAKALLSLPLLPGGGRCSALRGLVKQYRAAGVQQVVIVSGFHADVVEGEATAHYLAQLARQHNVKPTRLAHGVPLGGELEYVDRGTLSHAFGTRSEMLI